MSTIADNIESMAALVARVKKTHHLTEATVMRIVDMNFALAQSSGQPSLSGDEDIEFPDLPPELLNGEDMSYAPAVNEADAPDEEDPLATPQQEN